MDETALVRRVLSGDEAAQAEFLSRYEERLYRTAIHFLGYRDPEAEDMVQQTFVIAWEQLPGFKFEAQLYTWLNRICVNLCYDRLRYRQRQLLAQGQELDMELEKRAVAGHARGDEAAELDERRRLLRTELAKLHERCRQLIELRDLQGLSYAETGQRLKLPLGTVMSRLARCREALKQRIQRALRGAEHG